MIEGYNYAALAVPVFLVSTLGEAWLGQRQGRPLYAFGTAISDLSCGSVFQAIELLLKLFTLTAYIWLYDHHRVLDFADGSLWPWVIGMVGVDVLYYWWHRVSHVVNVMWAVHGVHHHSEDYNFAVALRQPIFEPITWFFFFFPLALLGVSPLIWVISYSLSLFYQFWLHTELIGKLPAPLAWVLNTPSHHRVHHGVEAKYLDRNYGAILIVWDRLFGSFQAEEEHPHYGTTVPLRSYNPVWANFAHLRRVWRLAALAQRWRDRLWVWFAHPGWLPAGVADPDPKPPDRATYEKYRPSASRTLKAYILLQLVFAGGGVGVLMFFEHQLSAPQIAAAATVLVAGFVAFSALIERKPWARPLEAARLLGSVAVVAWLMRSTG